MNDKTKPRRMSADEVAAICEGIWGNTWPSRLAESCGVHLNTAYKWKREGCTIAVFARTVSPWLTGHREALECADDIIKEFAANL